MKRQRIYDLFNTETKGKWYTKLRKKILQKKSFLRKRESGGIEQKTRKEGFLTALTSAIKDPHNKKAC